MNEKQFKQQSHDLVVNIVSTIGTFTTGLELSDDDLAKTQKLVKELGDSITEFIDGRRPKFVVGDYVVGEGDKYYKGKVISLIEEMSEDEKLLCSFYIPKTNEFFNFLESDEPEINTEFSRHATPEEIAEYEVALTFHKHGREPFEVKKNDIVSIDDCKRIINYPDQWEKDEFVVRGVTLLKTAEEVNEWLGADDERLNSSKEKA